MVPAVLAVDAGRAADAPDRHSRRDPRPHLLPGRPDAAGLTCAASGTASRRSQARTADDVRHPRPSFRIRLGHFASATPAPTSSSGVRLVNLVAHRGPDDSTFWHDGPFVARVTVASSIIDLSQGHQPMATDDGRLVVTFNGEIYNYIELRDELTARGHHFRTRSDTEVLLHGYREWGTGLPRRLRGMFAFAIADRGRRELFVARDRFGEKPLFYTQDGGGVSFASEMKVLAALPGRAARDRRRVAGRLSVPELRAGERDDAARRASDRSGDLAAVGGRRLQSRAGVYWTPPDPREPDLAASNARGDRAPGGAARFVGAGSRFAATCRSASFCPGASIRHSWRGAPRGPAGCRRRIA